LLVVGAGRVILVVTLGVVFLVVVFKATAVCILRVIAIDTWSLTPFLIGFSLAPFSNEIASNIRLRCLTPSWHLFLVPAGSADLLVPLSLDHALAPAVLLESF